MRYKFTLLIVGLLIVQPASRVFTQNSDSVMSVSLLALGDVNLGRSVGQEILKGKTDFPFEKFDSVLARAEVVFANLECPVTDQNGETQSPKSNVIFCAPPNAGATLRRAGVTVVSTANNHAFDYGVKGLQETIRFLQKDSIRFTGTVMNAGEEFTPAIIERNGIKFGILAYTQTVNFHTRWHGFISVFDSARAWREIHTLKPQVDFVIASYHGGDEYKDVPGASADRDMKLLADFGADIIFGHHPHVPNGIEMYRGCWIFHSLGNAVFNQPQRFWTQRSFTPLLEFEKRNGQKKISSIELIPFHPGYQPSTDLNENEIEELMNRIQMLSTVSITHTERGYFVKPSVGKASQ
ncbi:MAG: CapA family protein [Ignavibacteriales bacterium]|nr:CapA family protein [Ignavibacteriales bacterium]